MYNLLKKNNAISMIINGSAIIFVSTISAHIFHFFGPNSTSDFATKASQPFLPSSISSSINGLLNSLDSTVDAI